MTQHDQDVVGAVLGSALLAWPVIAALIVFATMVPERPKPTNKARLVLLLFGLMIPGTLGALVVLPVLVLTPPPGWIIFWYLLRCRRRNMARYAAVVPSPVQVAAQSPPPPAPDVPVPVADDLDGDGIIDTPVDLTPVWAERKINV